MNELKFSPHALLITELSVLLITYRRYRNTDKKSSHISNEKQAFLPGRY